MLIGLELGRLPEIEIALPMLQSFLPHRLAQNRRERPSGASPGRSCNGKSSGALLPSSSLDGQHFLHLTRSPPDPPAARPAHPRSALGPRWPDGLEGRTRLARRPPSCLPIDRHLRRQSSIQRRPILWFQANFKGTLWILGSGVSVHGRQFAGGGVRASILYGTPQCLAAGAMVP